MRPGFGNWRRSIIWKDCCPRALYTEPCGAKEEVRDFAFRAFQEDLVRMEYIPGIIIISPRKHVGQGAEKGIELIADLLNQSLKTEQTTLCFWRHGGKRN